MTPRTDTTAPRSRPVPAAPLIPRSVLFGNPERTSPALSPDASRLAWIAPDGGVLNLWVRDLSERPGSERVVTKDRERGIRAFAWAPDGTRLLYIQDTGGDENWRLFDVDLGTDDIRCLTPYPGVQARVVKVSKRRPGEILVGLNRDNPQLHDVYRLDLASGELVKVCENPGFILLVADEDLRVRAALAPMPDGGIAILVRDSDESAWRPLLQVSAQDALSTMPHSFSPDGSRLLCTTSVDAEAARLVWIDTATGEREVVASDATYDVAGVVLHPDTRQPLVVFFQRERLHAEVLDETVADDIAALADLDGGDLQLLGGDTADTVWLVGTVHDDGPVRYYTYDRTTLTATFLFADRPELESHQLAPMEPFEVPSRDGLILHGYITFPPGAPRRDLPAVVNVHGGPWGRDTWGADKETWWFADRGYVVIQVNFRGSAGYGKTFLNAGNREWGARMHDDLLDVLAWAVAQGWVDPTRVGIYGGSYGGYAALVGAAFTPGVFACAVALAAPTNLATLITSVPPYMAPILDQFHTRVGHPDNDKDFLWNRSPLSRVDEIRAPLLIAYGGNDPRVPQAECDQIVAALQTNGIPHECLLFPDEGHGFAKPENQERLYDRVERFLAEHLGGRFEDSTQDQMPDL